MPSKWMRRHFPLVPNGDGLVSALDFLRTLRARQIQKLSRVFPFILFTVAAAACPLLCLSGSVRARLLQVPA